MTEKVKVIQEVTVKEIDSDKLGVNPFIESLVIPVNKLTMTKIL